MKYFKRIAKYILFTLLAIALSVLLYLAAAFLLPSIAVEEEPASSNELTVYVITNGTHTDLVLPVRTTQIDWTQKIRHEHTTAADSSFGWIGIGWGDKGFYLEISTWGDLTPRIAVCAAFGLSTSAIHATYYRQMREGEDCRKINMSTAQYVRLVKYVTDSFSLTDNGCLIKIDTDAVYGRYDAFYEAKGRYSLLHTCNTWTNNALKSCGKRACWWTAFDKGIFYQYDKMKE